MGYRLKTAPYGAITSIEFLQSLVERANQGEPITLYEAYGLGLQSSIGTLKLCEDTILMLVGEEYSGPYLENVNPGVFGRASLNDRNIGENSGYNDNYFFLDPDLAADYVQFVKANKAMCESYAAEQAYYDRWDDYDDYGYDDRD